MSNTGNSMVYPIPEDREVEVECPACEGEKTIECPRCKGKNYIRISSYEGYYGAEVKCPNCYAGEVPCETCKGIGKIPIPRAEYDENAEIREAELKEER